MSKVKQVQKQNNVPAFSIEDVNINGVKANGKVFKPVHDLMSELDVLRGGIRITDVNLKTLGVKHKSLRASCNSIIRSYYLYVSETKVFTTVSKDNSTIFIIRKK